MSTIESVREAPPRARNSARPITWIYAVDDDGLAAGWLVPAWRWMQTDRILHQAILWGLAAWIGLELLFVGWVHFYCEGHVHYALMPGAEFGLPEREAAAGMQCVSKWGYDGQLYYHISNDLFGRADAKKHIDAPGYRYQRIGLPAAAGGLASLLGFPLTPPSLYFTLTFAAAGVALGTMVYWLVSHSMHPALALGWLFAAGTLNSLWLGLVDAPADMLFVLTLLAAIGRRLWLYAVAATCMLLTKETYAIYAFAIFVATWRGGINWSDVTCPRRRVVLTALPGVLMLAWTGYLWVALGASPFEARSNPGMYSMPLASMFDYFCRFTRNNNWFELRMITVTGVTIGIVSYLLLRNYRKLPVALLCAAPCLLLVVSTGPSIWEASGGSTRAASCVVVLAVMMAPYVRSALLVFALLLQAVAGIEMQVDARFMHGRILSPLTLHEEAGFVKPIMEGAPENPLLNDFRSRVEWVDHTYVRRRNYSGIWSRYHREIELIRVRVTNESDVAWERGLGKHPISVGYTLLNAAGTNLGEHRVILDQRVPPGESIELMIPLELRKPRRGYTLRLSMFQAGPGWFCEQDSTLGANYAFTVE